MNSFFATHKKLSYTLFAVGVLVLLLSPVFYLAIFSSTKFGEEITCKTAASASYAKTFLKDVVFTPEDWENAGIYLSGKIFFAPISDKFYLRDGVWSISVDSSGCENMDIFKNGAAPVSIFGTIRLENEELVLIVDDIFETVPAPARTSFNAGVYGLIGLAVLPITLFMRRIRIKKGWDPESEKEKKRQAFGPLFFGIMGAVAWFVNPVIGFFAFAFGIIAGRKFLRSPSRKLVIAGMALCAAGIASLGFLTASGTFAPNLGPDFFTAFEKSMEPEVDEKLPEVSQSADEG